MAFKPGEVCQFDWSQEVVDLGRPGTTRQSGAFVFFGGVPLQMVYDNPKTIVDTVLTGKERKFNRRFMALANHYLFEPVACTPAAGWGKGQIEN